MTRMLSPFALCLVLLASCQPAAEPASDGAGSLSAQDQLKRDLAMYEEVWFDFLNHGDTMAVNAEHFTEDVTIITDQGNIVGIEGVRGFYKNYLDGFSDIEFTVVDAFGQGDKIVKHWNFKGTHDGNFFGVPATGKRVDVSGVTLVKMKAGKIAAEQDFMDLLDFYTQLGLM